MKPITAREIAALVEEGAPVICFDVRERFRHTQLDAGGWQISYKEFEQHAAALRPHTSAIAVVCCLQPKGSKRTKIAAAALKKIGFSDVRELAEGIYRGWVLNMKKAKMPGKPIAQKQPTP